VPIERRIIPISSGKGGVGKTTVALNYALSLSRHGRTVLLDLDTGTSSIRNCLDLPVNRDLYHFFKKGHRLEDCITTLDDRLDPEGRYANFGFVASPRHLIEDIANLNAARREQLIDAINELKANFIVLDLKAGLDASVIEFLPYSNSGLLVFTPHLPAATLAAADIVKAALFRKLRAVFAADSPVYANLQGLTPAFLRELIDRVEDVYDSSVPNLDAFVSDLHHALGFHPVVALVANVVNSFLVYYVLNRFNGVKSSFETAVKPFVESLSENVSAHLTVMNMGWVVESNDINESNIQRVPILLWAEPARAAQAPDAMTQELGKLASLYLPGRPARATSLRRVAPRPSRSGSHVEVQLDTLRRMYEDLKGTSYRENFAYICARTMHVMSDRRISDFGDTRIFKSSELQHAMQLRGH
jgi:MinD-like ATPase involved in chromosome partitioning or flagellar assembly